MNGMIFDIGKFALHDGPGIRTTVFLKGCPLRCLWCHNPESQSCRPEIFFRPEQCLGCGRCFSACPRHCHQMRGGSRLFHRESCNGCGRCAAECHSGALERVGRIMSVEEVIAEVLKDKLFYEKSGGGITLSGGEPLAQIEFTAALLQTAGEHNLHTCLETSGFAPPEEIMRLVPSVDLWLWDVKACPKDHPRLTGVPAGPILENLHRLDRAGGNIILRCPLIPGVNDSPAHLTGIGELANSLRNVREIQLEPYHALGEGKRAHLGRPEVAGMHPPSPATLSEWLAVVRSTTSIPVKPA